ncbi:MAG: hypothetical protein JF888_09735 [Candidatus Dormibacteraeota bacterium]|uniref:Uncharacterized protein n=1 Tax=Candidatus Dormiibacter inghamiae TaxID=3127013 RepID=A0A934KH45_9BACT|nr:hypothetical protein [Candidatus Dormibacteraeota bacterium]MBJ7606730.1 hypothetical protein [Candidatus Dormibacteraeota bacterium]
MIWRLASSAQRSIAGVGLGGREGLGLGALALPPPHAIATPTSSSARVTLIRRSQLRTHR